MGDPSQERTCNQNPMKIEPKWNLNRAQRNGNRSESTVDPIRSQANSQPGQGSILGQKNADLLVELHFLWGSQQIPADPSKYLQIRAALRETSK